MDLRARADHDLLTQLETDRSTLTSHYQELARFIWPDHAIMYRGKASTPEGEKRAQEVVDSTAPIAADRCAAALMSMTAPSHRVYSRLDVNDDELDDNLEVRQWLEHTNETIFRRRYAPASGFGAQYHECCKSAVVFGPMGTFIEEMITDDGRSSNRYHSLSVSNTFFITDEHGRVVGMARRLEWTAQQLADKFGADKLPEKIRQALESQDKGKRLQKWTVVHIVQPAEEKNPVLGFTHTSRYSTFEGYQVLEERGYRGCPVAAARYATLPGEVYGRSIAMLVLPTIKGLNKMVRDFIAGVHKHVDPPLLTSDDDGTMSVIRAVPGKVTPGGLDDQGRERVKAFGQPTDLSWGEALIQDQRKQINDVFMTTLFQILAADKPGQQTAYEVSVREVEKAALLSPATDRINDEYQSALVNRELVIAEEAGELLPMPQVLAERRHKIKVTHTGDLSIAQQGEQILGIQRMLEVAPLFQAQDQASTQRINWDKAVELFGKGVGMPAELMLTDEEMAEAREEMEAQQQMAAAAELAPKAGQGAKSFAEAEQIRNSQAAGLGSLV